MATMNQYVDVPMPAAKLTVNLKPRPPRFWRLRIRIAMRLVDLAARFYGAPITVEIVREEADDAGS